MSHPNSSHPQSQSHRRCIYFSTDGVSVINLPLNGNETFSLIDSAGGDIRLVRFVLADADQITAALEAGAAFRFVKDTLHVSGPSGRLEFAPCVPDSAAGTTPALPGPHEIQRLHGA